MEAIIKNLVARFQYIDQERMQDLPIYNKALTVEAVDFQPVAHGWLGALITPWFINVVLLYNDDPPPAELGQLVVQQLPSGELDFMVGEDEVLGRYDFLSLASPVLEYKNQQAARHEARTRLQQLLTPQPQPMPSDAENNSVTEVDAGRRALLQGRVV